MRPMTRRLSNSLLWTSIAPWVYGTWFWNVMETIAARPWRPLTELARFACTLTSTMANNQRQFSPISLGRVMLGVSPVVVCYAVVQAAHPVRTCEV